MSHFLTSEEQQKVINHILDGDNVVVDAVAGSGKSTTVLSLARQVPPNYKILQLAYNAALREEVTVKLKTQEIDNVKVHTFHSLAVKYYSPLAHNDTELRKIVQENIPPKTNIPAFNIIVLDEAQDMSILYFKFMVKFGNDMGTRFQLLILGDYMQGIYGFKGADIRSLTEAHKIWRGHPFLSSPIFHQCSLQTSYRITNQIANFMNGVCLGTERLKATKDGPLPEYISNTPGNIEKIIVAKIVQFVDAGGSPGDIFVLAPSVKQKYLGIYQIENTLVERNIACYIPIFENEGFDNKVIAGKVVFSTYHAAKGRERPINFVMGFDQSYFEFHGQDYSPLECPSPIYVSGTRAMHKLFLVERLNSVYDRSLDFLKKTHREMIDEGFVTFNGVPREKFYEKSASDFDRERERLNKTAYIDVTPSESVKYIPDHIMENILPLIDRIYIQEVEPTEETTIDVPNVIPTSRGLYEDVCDLNGIAIPSLYCDHLFRKYAQNGNCPVNVGSNILRNIIIDLLSDTKKNQCLSLKREVDEFPEVCKTPADYLQLANLLIACKEQVLSKYRQILPQDYNWLTDEMVARFMERLDAIIGVECGDIPPLVEHSIIDHEMEVEIAAMNSIIQPFFPNLNKIIRFSGRADLITWKTLWELKCTNSITVEHKLQTVMYAWLWYVVNTPAGSSECSNKREVRIFNIKTGEVLRLNATFEELTIIVVEILRGNSKIEKSAPITNEDFLRECEDYMNSLITRNTL